MSVELAPFVPLKPGDPVYCKAGLHLLTEASTSFGGGCRPCARAKKKGGWRATHERGKAAGARKAATSRPCCADCKERFASQAALEAHVCGYEDDPAFEEGESGRRRFSRAGALVLGRRGVAP